MMRSLLFVPGDSERKLLKAISSGADALILDLEDSVALSRKTEARNIVSRFLTDTDRGGDAPYLIVRINALDSGLSDDDLAAVVSSAPDAILLPKAGSGADIQDLSARIAVHEAEAGLEDGKIRIHALMTETAAAVCSRPLRLPTSQPVSRPLPGEPKIWLRISARHPTRTITGFTPISFGWLAALRFSQPPIRALMPLTRYTPISGISMALRPNAGLRCATGSSARWRSIRIRWQ